MRRPIVCLLMILPLLSATALADTTPLNPFPRLDRASFERSGATGSQMSDPFVITRPFLLFDLSGNGLGGASWGGKTCVNLWIDDNIHRSSAGPNLTKNARPDDAPQAVCWYVKDAIGLTARLELRDRLSEPWGWIRATDFVLSDEAGRSVSRSEVRGQRSGSGMRPPLLDLQPPTSTSSLNRSRTLTVTQPWLLVPSYSKGHVVPCELSAAGGEPEMLLHLVCGSGEPDWLGALDVSHLVGRQLCVRAFCGDDADPRPLLDGLTLAASPPDAAVAYDEANRPQFHYTAPFGWMNDPNGLTFYRGEWHVFHQHNPFGTGTAGKGNMSWGHAVSSNLVDWTFLGDAVLPTAREIIYSGSAVVDRENTAGFGKDAHVLFYTLDGAISSQGISWSLDGRRYVPYAGNPVLPRQARNNRDPSVFWYAPLNVWVMLLYLQDSSPRRHRVGVFHSANLKDWRRVSTIEGDDYPEWSLHFRFLYECPDIFELPVAGTNERRWVIFGANGIYGIGQFDGCRFIFEDHHIPHNPGPVNSYYAAKTFAAVPDGRRVYLAWFQGGAPTRDGRYHSQGLSLPLEVGLVRTSEGIRMTRRPVRELAALRVGKSVSMEQFDGELLEAQIDCRVTHDAIVEWSFRGVNVTWNGVKGTLAVDGFETAWPIRGDRLDFSLFLDRRGLEIFSGDGLRLLPMPDVMPDRKNRRISRHVSSGIVTDTSRVWHLRPMKR